MVRRKDPHMHGPNMLRLRPYPGVLFAYLSVTAEGAIGGLIMPQPRGMVPFVCVNRYGKMIFIADGCVALQ